MCSPIKFKEISKQRSKYCLKRSEVQVERYFLDLKYIFKRSLSAAVASSNAFICQIQPVDWTVRDAGRAFFAFFYTDSSVGSMYWNIVKTELIKKKNTIPRGIPVSSSVPTFLSDPRSFKWDIFIYDKKVNRIPQQKESEFSCLLERLSLANV